jgi:hypothetical protein
MNTGMHLNTQAMVFFLTLEEGRKPLRGAICNVWEVERKQSPTFTNLWHASRQRQWRRHSEDEGEELVAAILLDGNNIKKITSLKVPADLGEAKARSIGLTPGQLSFASCHARMFARED